MRSPVMLPAPLPPSRLPSRLPSLRRPLALLGLALLSPAAAQEPVPVVLEGDAVAGVGLVTRVDNLAVNDLGAWRVEVDTDNADIDADGALLGPAGLVLREGDPLPLPAGATLDSFDAVTLTVHGTSGFNFFLDGTLGSNDDSGVYLDTTLIVQESDVVDSPLVSPGTPYIGFFEVKANNSDQLLVMASIDDPAIASSVDRALVVLDVTGGVYVSTDVLWKEGDTLPGQTETIADFGTGPHSFAFDSAGSALFFADQTGDTATDGVIYRDSTELAQEGDPSPVAGRNWLTLSSPELDLNSVGGHVYSGSLDGDPATNLLIVRNGAKLVQEGDTLPDLGGFLLTSFGSGPLWIDEDGDVVWYGDWDDPDTTRDTGLFLNDRLIVQEGVTTVGANTIMTLRGVQDGYALSPRGAYLLFEAVLDDGREGVFRLELPLGENYCGPAVPNSSGQGGRITATGAPVAGGNPLALTADQLPANEFGYFLVSDTQGFVANPGGSAGNLCLGGTIGRFASLVQSSGPAGTFSIDVDTLNLPLPPPAAIGSGETWSFQAWFRDGMTNNFTDGVAVTFE